MHPNPKFFLILSILFPLSATAYLWHQPSRPIPGTDCNQNIIWNALQVNTNSHNFYSKFRFPFRLLPAHYPAKDCRPAESVEIG